MSTNTVVNDLIDNIALKQGKTYADASRIVFGDGKTPGLGEKFGWLDSSGNITQKAIDKTNEGKEKRAEVRQFARKNNISVNDVKIDGRNQKPTFRG